MYLAFLYPAVLSINLSFIYKLILNQIAFLYVALAIGAISVNASYDKELENAWVHYKVI